MTKKKILDILADYVDYTLEELMNMSDNVLLADIGLESLSFIRFIVDLENKYAFEVDDNALIFSNMITIRNLVETFNKYFVNSSYKKVLICDCDDCLWHGVAGEEIIIIDDAAKELQSNIIELQKRGVIICLCSKNEEANISEAFGNRSMLITEEHILISKVNHHNKADNIQEIVAELNLSYESVVYIDNSEYEIELINIFLPEVTTIKIDYTKNILGTIDILNTLFLTTHSDIDRTQQYREQKLREKEKNKYKTIAEFNEFLETSLVCEKAEYDQAERIAELSQRTNQFNLSKARYSVHDICKMMNFNHYYVLALTAKDKFGDMGIVGAAIIQKETACTIIRDFFLSCRVFDRGFELMMLNKCKEMFGEKLVGVYYENEQNRRFKNFYSDNGVKLYAE